MNKITKIESCILDFLQGDLPLVSRPYQSLAEELGITENEIMETIHQLIQEKWIRRICGILYHNKVGYLFNALVAWNMNGDTMDLNGKLFAKNEFVSHCYHRTNNSAFPYSLFTMVHARSDQQLKEIIQSLVKISACHEYVILSTVKEWKKTSAHYQFSK